MTSTPLQLGCMLDSADHPVLRCEMTNTLDHTVHVFDSARMPYLWQDDDGELVVLHGVHGPLSLTNYNIVEIPVTRPLAPGERFSFVAELDSHLLPNHYEEVPRPTELRGECVVSARLGVLSAAVSQEQVSELGMAELLERQQVIAAQSIRVVLP